MNRKKQKFIPGVFSGKKRGRTIILKKTRKLAVII
jgi:hypothetical protein